jgi:hypothetical protein
MGIFCWAEETCGLLFTGRKGNGGIEEVLLVGSLQFASTFKWVHNSEFLGSSFEAISQACII